ncbi:hypothetical protein OKW76_00325 [Sphingomonas sp. S1-29]|uniref:hypothetical protein n=1 Tax=Sphingomonas sp. S1-29 TaxID=2991074 RepID=UPI00223FEF45|nr:hypothetical protein [Sphingomonas sp. S1-29]UZK69570.1 hypothetical protein OKW76_00325 [Sphingomonas sp. S1-29]
MGELISFAGTLMLIGIVGLFVLMGVMSLIDSARVYITKPHLREDVAYEVQNQFLGLGACAAVIGCMWLFSENIRANREESELVRIETIKTDVGLDGFEDGRNYSCTDDCSGHEAGFEWAAHYRSLDAFDCSDDNGDSFQEGCFDYIEEVERRIKDTEA